MKILLFSYFFHPDPHVGAVRWNRLSKYLKREGHEVYVLAANNGIEGNCSSLCNMIVRIDSESHPFDRLLNKTSKLKTISIYQSDNKDYGVRKMRGIMGMRERLAGAIGRWARFPDRHWWCASEFARAGSKIAKSNQLDVIVATHPFPCCLRAAYMLSNKTGIPWVADMRDGWSSYYNSVYRPGTLLSNVLAVPEGYYLGNASRVVTVNAGLANTLNVSRDKIRLIANAFDPETVSFDSSICSQREGNLILAFAGSILKEHCWGVLLQVIKEIAGENNRDSIAFDYYGNDYGVLRANGNLYGLSPNIFRNHGFLSPHLLKVELRKADLLVVFGFSGACGDTVTTAKIFDYIEAGKPVLVVGPATSELADMVKRTGIGLVLSEPMQLKIFLKSVLDNKQTVLNNMLIKRSECEIMKYSARESANIYAALLSEVSIESHKNGS